MDILMILFEFGRGYIPDTILQYNWCRNLGLILMLITLLDAILLRAYFIITMLPLLILNIIYITGTRNNAEIDSNRNL